ncbi:unnamed protein product [Ectocarpus sp. 12 AP-2014]
MVEPTESAPSLYDAIGVNAGASAEKIRRKTRKLINDVKESDKKTSEKNELIRFFKDARETLSDRDARIEYDRSIGIETISANNDQAESVVPFDRARLEHQSDSFHPCPLGGLSALGGALGALSAFGPIGPVGPAVGHAVGRTSSTPSMGSASAPVSAPRTSSATGSPAPPPSSGLFARSAASFPGPLSLVGMLDTDAEDMFSHSIVPEELSASSCIPGGLQPGNFQVLEYTKVRNPGGGFDEFGYTRHGDLRNDRVTEKRFERKS